MFCLDLALPGFCDEWLSPLLALFLLTWSASVLKPCHEVHAFVAGLSRHEHQKSSFQSPVSVSLLWFAVSTLPGLLLLSLPCLSFALLQITSTDLSDLTVDSACLCASLFGQISVKPTLDFFLIFLPGSFHQILFPQI